MRRFLGRERQPRNLELVVKAARADVEQQPASQPARPAHTQHPSPGAMTTIPSRLAQAASVSSNLLEAQARSRSLYRQFYRSAPEICGLYALDVPPSLLRAKFRTQFEKHRHITDLAVLDVLLLKAQQEYQETMNAWKQLPQVMKWFAEEESAPKPQTFLENFYAGRDEPKSV
ncbi:ndufa6 NADH-ubiquinone oxidoreductase subunit [Tilletia horrida]|nr:ndufa6 NADH-ubiquinone oxidoreductase subunit [Tilletia horrida]